MELPPAAFFRLDLYPAVVKGDAVTGGVVDKTRAYVTDAHVHIFKLAPAGDVDLIYSWELDTFSGDATTGYTATTADGDEIFIKRSAGCGCGGGRIKSFRPFSYPVPMQRG